ncbi:MAG: zinc ribbon domain-containing protein YjdM [Aerococcaceae bacterium]|nr:zinc ribbon domain-containing protein YjdM [Aerococcaceae bacterium]
MTTLPNCPKCASEYTYQDGDLLICPMCAHEWTQAEAEAAQEASIIRDANGNPLADGDTVTVIKDLKLNGSTTIKQGTKAKGIRLVADPVDGHDIQCKIDGIGALYLKSIYVKK